VKHTAARWLEYLIVIRGVISEVFQPEIVSFVLVSAVFAEPTIYFW